MIRNIRKASVFFIKILISGARKYLQRTDIYFLLLELYILRFILSQRVGKCFLCLDKWLSLQYKFPEKYKQSNSISRVMRPWFEYRRISGIFGANIIAAVAMVGVTGTPVSATLVSNETFSSSITEVSVVEVPKEVMVSTERSYQIPVVSMGISQGFSSYHPGLDIRAVYGSDIRPVASGTVSDIRQSSWGYGRYMIIDHADGYSSLYAHLGKIFVEKESSIDQNTVIAQVGMSGYTTGPHLHLEIYKYGKVVNPRFLLGY